MFAYFALTAWWDVSNGSSKRDVNCVWVVHLGVVFKELAPYLAINLKLHSLNCTPVGSLE